MVKYGVVIEHKNGKKEFLQYNGKDKNVELIEKQKDFYHKNGSKIFLVKFDVNSGHYVTLEKTEY